MSTATRLAAIAVTAGLTAWPLRSAPRPPIHTATAVTATPVRLILDQARYAPGANGRVRVQIGEDGYLVVLYAQPDGHVAMAYPIDPTTPDRVRADTEIEIHSRGGRAAFSVDDSSGSGTWYAAISEHPFRFDAATLNGHWDYHEVPRATDPDKVEAELTAFVKSLSTARFEYDIVSFVIDTAATPSSSSAEPASSEPPVVTAPPDPPPDPWWAGPWATMGRWWPWWWGPASGWPGPYYDRTMPGGAGGPNGGGPATPSAPGTASDAQGVRGEGGGGHHAEGSGGHGVH
jgi:hypothetical protein